MKEHNIELANYSVGNRQPLLLIAGINVLESYELAAQVCEELVRETQKRGIPLVFKASFDKANRTSSASFRGPGLQQGVEWLQRLREEFAVLLLTDVHEVAQVDEVAAVADVLQIPAFLARQTDLVRAVAETGRPIHIKKPQYMAPDQVVHIVEKCQRYGNDSVMLCERGTFFGYHHLVVDPLGIDLMKQTGFPVILDVSHSLQCRSPLSPVSSGRNEQIDALTRMGVALGLAGLFVELHPYPERALCDGACALPLDQLAAWLDQVDALDRFIKGR